MSFIVDIEAARALAKWKQFFADEVTETAKRMALDEGTSRITFEHYQQAAQQAMLALEQEVQRESVVELGWEEAA
ncbi:MAG: hypothetical protein U0930_01365 [Pirellulales bacterium]